MEMSIGRRNPGRVAELTRQRPAHVKPKETCFFKVKSITTVERYFQVITPSVLNLLLGTVLW